MSAKTKAQYTRCDLVTYDLVVSYGIESSMTRRMRHTAVRFCNAHVAIYRLYATKLHRVYWA